ncbi:MAG: hypothetical protein COS89_05135 [Deltaproteobacteria bacterium CG07_land_8_20_14_0_80_38_7]|nr:MAG: hypothetical protein COS89_05135 [Deltaproteobacteria bacterium CG07_land_8_20_14_0_80_38_7]
MFKAKTIVLLIIISILIPFNTDARECIKWSQLMQTHEINQPAKGKLILVQQFVNYTKRPEDEWLTSGITELISSMLKAQNDATILSGNTLNYLPKTSKPDFIITGMFQSQNNVLRIFTKVLNAGDQKLLYQFTTIAPYPQTRDLFTNLANTTQDICNKLKLNLNKDLLQKTQNTTDSVPAYEAYIKGLLALHKYDVNDAEVARIWFEQSISADHRFALAYQGLIDLYSFLGFYYKQQHKPFGTYYQKAEQLIQKMNKMTLNKENGSNNRFLLGHAAFTQALIDADAGKFNEASVALNKSVELVPEDAIAWYELSRVSDQLGNKQQSSEALQKAHEINTCLGEQK